MTALRYAIVLSCAIVPCGALAGCAAMSQPFPDKDFFAIQAGSPNKPAAKRVDAVVRVRRLRVAQPFDSRTFVYKVGPAQYKTDYYNGFIASPDELLTGELIRWLTESEVFTTVLDSSGEGDHRYVLDGIVTRLYGDYTDEKAPKAVIEARFFLADDIGAETRIVFQKTYRNQQPLKKLAPEALAAAMGLAYKEILTELSADLGNARLGPASGQAARR